MGFFVTVSILSLMAGTAAGCWLLLHHHARWRRLAVLTCAALFCISLLMTASETDSLAAVGKFLLGVMGPAAFAIGLMLGGLLLYILRLIGIVPQDTAGDYDD